MQFYEINICQVMNFRLYTVYNKYDMIKIFNQTNQLNPSWVKCPPSSPLTSIHFVMVKRSNHLITKNQFGILHKERDWKGNAN